MSVDEAANILENFGDALQGRLGSSHPVFVTHGWVPYGFGFVLVVGLVYLNIVRQVARRLRFPRDDGREVTRADAVSAKEVVPI